MVSMQGGAAEQRERSSSFGARVSTVGLPLGQTEQVVELNMSLTSLQQQVIYYNIVMESGWKVVGEGVGCRNCGSAPGTGNGAEYVPHLTATTGNTPFSHGRMEGSGWEGVGEGMERAGSVGLPLGQTGQVMELIMSLTSLQQQVIYHLVMERMEGSGWEGVGDEVWVCPWDRQDRWWS